MNRSAVIFSNLSCNAMAGIAPTAIVQNPMLYLAKRAKWIVRMYPMQKAIYRYHQNPDAQHQAAPLEVVAGHVLHRPFEQGSSSVFLGKWVGISQKSAWKIGHAVRKMMDPCTELVPALQGIVELDEKYIAGTPRYEHGIKHKRGRGTQKQRVLVEVERNGPVR